MPKSPLANLTILVGSVVIAYLFIGWFGLAIVLTVIVPAALLWWLESSNQPLDVPEGYCKHCGYDLRASPDRCPECGTLRDDWMPPRAAADQDAASANTTDAAENR